LIRLIEYLRYSYAKFWYYRSPFPWFYFLFFMVMIIHRARRDIDRCRRKYGDSWAEYEKAVPICSFL
jgi:hypothetical protein